jgi:hypothetical protein
MADEHDEARVQAALRTATDHLRMRPSLLADVRRGARRRRRRNVTVAAAGTMAATLAATAVGAYGVAGPATHQVAPTPTGGSADTSPSPSSAVPALPRQCVIERLPLPGKQPKSVVTGGDRTGRYLLGRAYDGTGYQARHPILIWDDLQPRVLSMPGEDEALNDINSSGVAVGSSFTGTDTETPWVYQNGKVSKLTVQGSATATAIGEQGVVVGTRRTSSRAAVPVAWRSTTGPAVDLPLPGKGWEGEAMDVDADGTVVGRVRSAVTAETQGYVWLPDSTARLLPLPTIDGVPAVAFFPSSIAQGRVVGVAHKPFDGGFEVVVVVLDLRTGEFLPPAQARYGAGNSLGWVAGGSKQGYVLASANEHTALPRLPAPRPDTPPFSVDIRTVSEDGHVIGGQVPDATGEIQAVVWRCT